MSDNPTVKIEISGHTDSIGTDGANITLSTDRARAVKTYLVAAGIADSRMVAKGYGRSKPVATNATEEGRQENRRVEFTILR
ncbi:MAG: OmpA/MotB domain protein [Chlorobi bacterium OLB6]|nr:MAG: OmpA/MotB domain protein [Chlorobi bacterium OLB6]MBW7853431.1 OmpA family protein [Candidatus Kapabacteria bacterium]